MGRQSRAQGHSTPWLLVRVGTATSATAALTRLDSKAQRVVENSHAADLKLTDADDAEIWALIDKFETKGKRYFDVDPRALHLWG